MLRLIFLLTLCYSYLAHPRQPLLRQHSTCPIVLPLQSSRLQRVLGGRPLQHDDMLFHAWVMGPGIYGNLTLCSATRLSKNWVLTAAHCLVTPQFRIQFGEPSVPLHAASTGARIQRVFTHPNYTLFNPNRVEFNFDLALLRIVPPFYEPSEVPFVRLNADPSLPVEDAFTRVSGYGIFDWNVSNSTGPVKPITGELHFVDIPIHSFSACNRSYVEIVEQNMLPLNKDWQVCAGYVWNPCNLCSGDSGGPFLQFDTLGRAVQVAVNSASFGCVRPGYPSIGVRVSPALEWFRSVGAVFETAEPEQVFRNNDVNGGAVSSAETSEQTEENASLTETPVEEMTAMDVAEDKLGGADEDQGGAPFGLIIFGLGSALTAAVLGVLCLSYVRKMQS